MTRGMKGCYVHFVDRAALERNILEIGSIWQSAAIPSTKGGGIVAGLP
jgi:hypothetical protein